MRLRLSLPLQVDTDIDGIKVFILAGLLNVLIKLVDILRRCHGKYPNVALRRRLVQGTVHLTPTQSHNTMTTGRVYGAVKRMQVVSLLVPGQGRPFFVSFPEYQ